LKNSEEKNRGERAEQLVKRKSW